MPPSLQPAARYAQCPFGVILRNARTEQILSVISTRDICSAARLEIIVFFRHARCLHC